MKKELKLKKQQINNNERDDLIDQAIYMLNQIMSLDMGDDDTIHVNGKAIYAILRDYHGIVTSDI